MFGNVNGRSLYQRLEAVWLVATNENTDLAGHVSKGARFGQNVPGPETVTSGWINLFIFGNLSGRSLY